MSSLSIFVKRFCAAYSSASVRFILAAFSSEGPSLAMAPPATMAAMPATVSYTHLTLPTKA